MAISGTTSRYDTILMHRQNQRDAAALRDARSQSRRDMAQTAMAKSAQVRNALANSVAQTAADQSNLTAQLIRARMATQAAQMSAPAKWYR